MDHAGSSISLTITAQHTFDGTAMCGPGAVRISHGRIESSSFGEAGARASIHLPANAILTPGFIDIQANGGGGIFLNDQPTEAGVRCVGAALEDDRPFAGIICDGIHVGRAGLRVAFRCKGRDRLMLVTDAMPSVGTNDRRADLVAINPNFEVTWIAGVGSMGKASEASHRG
jgi:N-acetylglucosamine-6-phosphate deacetylase